MLELNTIAPDFALKDSKGEIHHLTDFRGKKVLLYFYPKDNTPGCTKQACNYSLNQNDYSALNTVIIGISKDSTESHVKFIRNHSLTILLLSDPDLEAIQAYDVWKEKKNYGKTFMGVVRTTYLINEEGKIIYHNDKVKAEQDALNMLEVVKAL